MMCAPRLEEYDAMGRGHNQGAARSQMDDCYFLGRPEDLLLLSEIMEIRLPPHGGEVRRDKGRWWSNNEEIMDQWPAWCKSDEAGGYKGLLCSGAPIGPRGFVRGVVGQLVHKCNSDATKIKNTLADEQIGPHYAGMLPDGHSWRAGVASCTRHAHATPSRDICTSKL